MQRTRVKICGIMRPRDAIAAAHAGVDAVGFILHRSAKRFVAPDLARSIIASLPPFVTPVGLFVDEPFGQLIATANALGLRHVQLHGEETPEYAARLADRIVLKAIRVDRLTFATELARWKHGPPNVRGIVLETANTGQAGGSGIENDWSTVRDAIDRGLFAGLPPIIAAGGIRPENVANVMRVVRPWAIDVSSGVEETRGEKSEARINLLMQVVRATDASQQPLDEIA